MRKAILILFVALVGISASYLAPSPQVHRTATVQTMNGFHIYVFSEPTDKYEVQETVKAPDMTTWNGSPQQKIKRAMHRAEKKIKKQDLEVDGLIFSNDLTYITLIKFEEEEKEED